MKRRDLVAGLALAGIRADGDEPESASLYIPRPQRVEDRRLLHDFMDEFSFVELITASPDIRITHIPVLLDRDAGRYGTLYGHIARGNPQNETFDGRHAAIAVFRGPHSYISPTCYTATEAVPTWNFAVVHASGKLNAITAPKAFHELLAKLVRKFETSATYDFSKLPDSYTQALMAGIVGFAMEIDRLEGKFKLGQERSQPDREGILRYLRSAKPERSIADLAAGFYERQKPAP